MGLLLNLKKKFTLVGTSLLGMSFIGMSFNGWRDTLISASEVQQKQAIVRLRVEPTESPETAFFEQSFLDNGLQLPTTGVDRLYFMLGFGFLLMLWLFWLARQIQFLSTRKE